MEIKVFSSYSDIFNDNIFWIEGLLRFYAKHVLNCEYRVFYSQSIRVVGVRFSHVAQEK